ncbi:MAG: hypothetical protein WBG62_19715, partial [Cyclobacteriaceae bacterium]
KGVAAIFRTNAEGRTYGITFVDNVTRAAFKGSDLGKGYGVNALLNRMEGKPLAKPETLPISCQIKQLIKEPRVCKTPDLAGFKELIEGLTSGYIEEDIAYGFRKKKKGRRIGL